MYSKILIQLMQIQIIVLVQIFLVTLQVVKKLLLNQPELIVDLLDGNLVLPVGNYKYPYLQYTFDNH